MNAKSLLILATGIVAFAMFDSSNAAPPAADQKLLITSVMIADQHDPAGPDTLIIYGMNFTSGVYVPIVHLHGVGDLFVPVEMVTADTIVAELPDAGIEPGDYLLSISTSPAVVDSDTYALTIGTSDMQFFAGVGLILDGNELSVDIEQLQILFQSRVFQFCQVGAAIREISEDGTVTCEVDNDTKYTAGFGLQLIGTQFEVDAQVVQRRIVGGCPPGWAIRSIDLAGSITCIEVSVP